LYVAPGGELPRRQQLVNQVTPPVARRPLPCTAMSALPTRVFLATGALAATLLAACGANGEVAPADSGCPVGVAASSCSTPTPSAAATASSTPAPNPCTTAPTPSATPGGDSFCRFVAITNTLGDGLQWGDITVGTGAAVAAGSKITVQYTGWLQATGVMFDTSRQSGRGPFSLTLGAHSVIAGWEEGIPGMKVGGKRRLVIPSALAYGAQGYPPTIPANAILVFDIELVSTG
jgi:FKBP-type peptidyl-prolyl cis-trans isomerase FkpA